MFMGQTRKEKIALRCRFCLSGKHKFLIDGALLRAECNKLQRYRKHLSENEIYTQFVSRTEIEWSFFWHWPNHSGNRVNLCSLKNKGGKQLELLEGTTIYRLMDLLDNKCQSGGDRSIISITIHIHFRS